MSSNLEFRRIGDSDGEVRLSDADGDVIIYAGTADFAHRLFERIVGHFTSTSAEERAEADPGRGATYWKAGSHEQG